MYYLFTYIICYVFIFFTARSSLLDELLSKEFVYDFWMVKNNINYISIIIILLYNYQLCTQYFISWLFWQSKY